jgi:hypothetical protein
MITTRPETETATMVSMAHTEAHIGAILTVEKRNPVAMSAVFQTRKTSCTHHHFSRNDADSLSPPIILKLARAARMHCSLEYANLHSSQDHTLRDVTLTSHPRTP